jgi:ribosomal-protein-alanine N-acetyltransferase
MSDYSITTITKSDIKDLYHIHKASFKEVSWDLDIFESFLGSGSYGWRHEYGFILLRMHDILTLCVLPQKRRRSIASHLIEETLKNISAPVYLEVSTTNTSAIRLYQSYGFRLLALRKNYYGLHKDAFLLGYGV